MIDGKRARRWINRGILILAMPMIFVIYVPQALAFPHYQRFGSTQVWSEMPIPASFPAVLARADALVASSPLAGGDATRRLFLTQGGWRWRVLAVTSGRALGLRRPFSPALLFNRHDALRDRLFTPFGTRSLSGVIAHETSHLLIARRIGELRMARLPAWVSEGLADFVARESTLSDADVERVRQAQPDARAIFYYDARRRVARTLAANGGSVDRLFDEAR